MAWVPCQAYGIGKSLKQLASYTDTSVREPLHLQFRDLEPGLGQGRPPSTTHISTYLQTGDEAYLTYLLLFLPFYPGNPWWQESKALLPQNSSKKFKNGGTWQTLLTQVLKITYITCD